MKYIDKIYGEFEITGVIEELINTRVFQRLKGIHQGGAIFLVNPEINHTRFEHSIGVMLLIKKLRGSSEEQIAGLIHDISHTAFSHLIDYVLEIEEEDYHEKRFEEVLRDNELNAVLKKYQLDINKFIEIENYQILEYPLPNLSADRIDYTLRDLFQIGKITRKEILWFLSGLKIVDNRIVLISEEHAKWFQSKYEFLVAEYFGGKQNKGVNILMKKIVKDCLTKGIIQEEDFYQDDFYLIDKINRSVNLKKMISEINSLKIENEKITQKKRKIDPEILVDNRVLKLSEIS
ncbi:HD superfamily phosphohydrolase [Galbibacter orientalis DSM 19592]|uniref:HD superfamily phosphohydrolase n=1 Tax=Galbibacter orientalis DSM 19592 TaxID=926559 RepID=I3CAK8_9FLAO|nr:HD domain-containing protein [Galbibacter orientalis]EIJ40651.1 HD superfamily phosphohydrolase [Galbibacter orientalis DSM 19592]